jgi:hypothetical protein
MTFISVMRGMCCTPRQAACASSCFAQAHRRSLLFGCDSSSTAAAQARISTAALSRRAARAWRGAAGCALRLRLRTLPACYRDGPAAPQRRGTRPAARAQRRRGPAHAASRASSPVSRTVQHKRLCVQNGVRSAAPAPPPCAAPSRRPRPAAPRPRRAPACVGVSAVSAAAHKSTFAQTQLRKRTAALSRPRGP